jgi:hypothetical protein
MDFPIYKCIIDETVESNVEVDFVALVDKPAIEKNFMAFSAEKMKFNVDDKRRIISGPAMIANMLIYRNVEPLGEFYTFFDKETIQSIALKFFKKGYMQNLNIMHDENQKTEGVTIFESFLTDSTRGILPMKGFEDVADGSWFISAKVDDDATWTKVTDGTLKGFSVEGIFKQIPVKQQKMSADTLLERMTELLRHYEG